MNRPPSSPALLETVLAYWRAGGAAMLVLGGISIAILYTALRGHRTGRTMLKASLDARSDTPPDPFEAGLATLHRERLTLRVLTSAAPLMGLFGTVNGMIRTFRGVALDLSHITPTIAEGISRALVTTQMGLAVAIPGLIGQAWLRRLARVISGRAAAHRLHRIQNPDAGPGGS